MVVNTYIGVQFEMVQFMINVVARSGPMVVGTGMASWDFHIAVSYHQSKLDASSCSRYILKSTETDFSALKERNRCIDRLYIILLVSSRRQKHALTGLKALQSDQSKWKGSLMVSYTPHCHT